MHGYPVEIAEKSENFFCIVLRRSCLGASFGVNRSILDVWTKISVATPQDSFSFPSGESALIENEYKSVARHIWQDCRGFCSC